MAWPDAFRGLVVFFIAVFHTALLLVAAGIGMGDTAAFVDHLQSLGMGLFFAISGMNSRRYIDGTRREFVAGRLWPMVYLLVLWGAISFSVATLLGAGATDLASFVKGLAITVVIPASHLWFLWSLIVYLLAARLIVRRFPRTALLAALALSIACTTLDSTFFHRHGLYFIEQHWAWRRVLSYPFFFFLGYRHFDRLAALARLPLLPTLIGTLMIAEGLPHLAFSIHRTAAMVPMLYLSLIAGLVCAIQVGRLIALAPVAGMFLRWIGRLTLPVYLMHMLLAMPMVALAMHLDAGLVRTHGAAVVAIVALLSVAGSLGLAFLFPRLGLVWLIRAPGMDDSRYRRPRVQGATRSA